MTLVLLDTDVIIEVLRGTDAAILDKWGRLMSEGDLIAYSPVTAAELWHSVRKEEASVVANLLESLTCIPADYAVGKLAGDYLRKYHKSHGLLIADALIAASASIHGCALWTRNRKHYPMRDIKPY